MSSDEKVRENSACAEVAMLTAPFRVGFESVARRAPNPLTEFPINCDSGVFKEAVDEFFGASWGGDQFGEHRSGHDEISAAVGSIKRVAGGHGLSWVSIPQGDKDVGVDRGGHYSVSGSC